VSTLKSDHGKFASAEDGGGEPGQIIDGRPAGWMTANRDSAGAWETFEIVESDEPEIYGIKSAHGKFACCENEGKDGIIVFNRDSIGAWEKFKIHDVESGTKIAFESVCRPLYFIKVHGDGTVKLEQSMYENKPSETPGGWETFVIDPPLRQVGTPPKNFITGQLRIDGSGYRDDNGPYLPIGIHMGDLFSCFCYGKMTEVQNALSSIRDAGYGLVQFWLNLGSLGGDYWAGREIGPEITPDFWGKLNQFSDLLDSYGLKGIYCTGDYALRGMSHGDFARQLGQSLAGRTTGALVIAGNEAWQTGADSIDTLEDFCDAFKSCCPNVPITTTAPPTEAENDIAAWCGGDYYAIHGYRGAEDHDRIRHIFSVPWEGHPPCEYGYQDEPTGPGDEVSVKASHCYDGRDVDANHLVALAVQSLNCNQGYNFFCGDGVKLTGDVSRWPGFWEVATVVNWVPKDIMSWPGPIHFGTTQADRIFEPTAENTLRFDHRINGDRFFGMFYGDEGSLRARCKRACFLSLIEFDGTPGPEVQYDLGQEIHLSFVRSQNGEPGYTAQFVTGRLR
jgi:hypothetical protein